MSTVRRLSLRPLRPRRRLRSALRQRVAVRGRQSSGSGPRSASSSLPVQATLGRPRPAGLLERGAGRLSRASRQVRVAGPRLRWRPPAGLATPAGFRCVRETHGQRWSLRPRPCALEREPRTIVRRGGSSTRPGRSGLRRPLGSVHRSRSSSSHSGSKVRAPWLDLEL